jgi:hypothetical protein
VPPRVRVGSSCSQPHMVESISGVGL